MRCPQGPAGGRVPGGRAVSSRLSRSLTPLASRRSWTRSRTPQSMSPRSRKTWTSCTTRWTWRTPVTVAPTWRMTTASSAPPSRSSGGHGRASILDAGTAACLQSRRPVGASREAAHRVVLGAGREGGVRGSRPSGLWALGRGWTGGTDPEGALGLWGFQRWGVAKGESSLEPARVSPAGGRVREGGVGGMWTWEGPVVPWGCLSCRELGGALGAPQGQGCGTALMAGGRGQVGGCSLAWSQGSLSQRQEGLWPG